MTPFHQLPLEFWFKMVDPVSPLVTICYRNPSISGLFWCKRSMAIAFLVSLHLSAFATPNQNRPWNRQPLKYCHYTDSTDGQDGTQIICSYATDAAYQFINPADVVGHHCSKRARTFGFVTKCHSSYFSRFSPSYPSSNTGVINLFCAMDPFRVW